LYDIKRTPRMQRIIAVQHVTEMGAMQTSPISAPPLRMQVVEPMVPMIAVDRDLATSCYRRESDFVD
jgi:hypothetical protein